ncbi:MAG: hypothetical protein RLZZ524_506 [Pseudomonadota bacterium]
MSLLTTAQLEGMRATLERSLPGTAVITRRTWASDGGGGGTAGYSAVGTAPCRLSPSGQTPLEADIASQVQGRAPYMVTLATDTDVQSGDRITTDSRTFEVLKALSRDWEISLRVVCVELI